LVVGGSRVEGGFDGEATALQDVGVDHGGFDVPSTGSGRRFVAEEFLDGADVVVVLGRIN
jgi:hypothetical protein